MKSSPSPTAAYIHIPFCRRRCYYCDFPVSIVGDRTRGETSGAIAQYVEILRQEILTTSPLGQPLETVFFGGGTPSLLSVAQLTQILQTLDQRFGIAANAEISIEIDPGTFDLTHLQGYKAAGVSRVSLGVQSFDAKALAACGRTHTPDDVYAAVDLIHHVGLPNFSLDLISGLPYQTPETWDYSLQEAIALQPTHLSVYDLIVEPVTAFGRWYKPGDAPLPSDDATAEMYRTAQQTLTQAGYDHYEISNYAKPGYQCRHNRVYWENRPYYAFGMGAASYTQGQRFTRPRTRQEYFRWVESFTAAHGVIDWPITSLEESVLDILMLGLRLAEGLNLKDLGDRVPSDTLNQILACLHPYQDKGWVEITPDSIRLTDPEGFLFSNVVLTTLFEKLGSE